MIGSLGLLGVQQSKIRNKKPPGKWFFIGIVIALAFALLFANSFK